jgi:hypothetical protein
LARIALAGRERRSDLPVFEVRPLAHDERGALALGQGVQVGDDLGHALAADGLLVGAGGAARGAVRVEQRLLAAAAADQVDRLVVDDPEQPRPHRRLARLGAERDERLHPGALEDVARVLGVLHDRHAVAVKRAVVAAVEHREGRVAPGARHGGEPLVGEHSGRTDHGASVVVGVKRAV